MVTVEHGGHLIPAGCKGLAEGSAGSVMKRPSHGSLQCPMGAVGPIGQLQGITNQNDLFITAAW